MRSATGSFVYVVNGAYLLRTAVATGATDGLFLRNAGIPVYGVSGLFGEIGDNRAHGQDERILIRSFFEGQEFLYRLTKALSSEDL